MFRVWVSGLDGEILAQNLEIPSKKTHEGGRLPPSKNSLFSENYCFYEAKLPVFEKFGDFHATLDNFLASVVISYKQSEVIFFSILTGI